MLPIEYVKIPREIAELLVDMLYSDWHRGAEEDEDEPLELVALREALAAPREDFTALKTADEAVARFKRRQNAAD